LGAWTMELRWCVGEEERRINKLELGLALPNEEVHVCIRGVYLLLFHTETSL
jgi:hypothetical protein